MACVCSGLSKEFSTPTGIKKAVDDLNLTMYSGQITALLGHNGAGESQTAGNWLAPSLVPGYQRSAGADLCPKIHGSSFTMYSGQITTLLGHNGAGE
jgi:ABC-type multidrug transport system ATPase subunit